MLAYLSRYTHRVAISNRRLIAADDKTASRSRSRTTASRVAGRYKTMTLDARRVHPPLPDARAAEGLPSHPPLRPAGERREGGEPRHACANCSTWRRRRTRGAGCRRRRRAPQPCPCCGAAMHIIERFEPGEAPRHRPRSPASSGSIRHERTARPQDPVRRTLVIGRYRRLCS